MKIAINTHDAVQDPPTTPPPTLVGQVIVALPARGAIIYTPPPMSPSKDLTAPIVHLAFGSLRRDMCPSFWRGRICAEWRPCPDVCQNEAICTTTDPYIGYGYTCKCPVNWTGPNCTDGEAQ